MVYQMEEKHHNRERKVGQAIRSMNGAFKNRFLKEGLAVGLDEVTIMHGWIMGYLKHNEHRDIYQKTIESDFSIGRSSVTSLVKLMENKGYIARDMEKKGMVSDRCELNRQIRSDNRLLGELKKQVAKLTKSIKDSIPAIAETLENIRGAMIIFQYQMLHNEMQTASAKDWIEMTKPVIEKYKATKQEIHKKQEERKILKTKKISK